MIAIILCAHGHMAMAFLGICFPSVPRACTKYCHHHFEIDVRRQGCLQQISSSVLRHDQIMHAITIDKLPCLCYFFFLIFLLFNEWPKI